MKKPITIIDAKQQFQDWRSNKALGSSIPTKLWDLENKMLEYKFMEEICHSTKITINSPNKVINKALTAAQLKTEKIYQQGRKQQNLELQNFSRQLQLNKTLVRNLSKDVSDR